MAGSEQIREGNKVSLQELINFAVSHENADFPCMIPFRVKLMPSMFVVAQRTMTGFILYPDSIYARHAIDAREDRNLGSGEFFLRDETKGGKARFPGQEVWWIVYELCLRKN